MNEEIVAGIRNALDRGFTIEKAVQSFINAGYSEREVREAASSISGGAISFVSENSNEGNDQSEAIQVNQTQDSNENQQTPQPEIQQTQPPKKKSHTTLIIVLIIVLGVLGIALAASIIYSKEILAYFKGL